MFGLYANQPEGGRVATREKRTRKKVFQENVFSHQRIETAMETALFFFFHFLNPCQHQTHPGTFQPAWAGTKEEVLSGKAFIKTKWKCFSLTSREEENTDTRHLLHQSGQFFPSFFKHRRNLNVLVSTKSLLLLVFTATAYWTGRNILCGEKV